MTAVLKSPPKTPNMRQTWCPRAKLVAHVLGDSRRTQQDTHNSGKPLATREHSETQKRSSQLQLQWSKSPTQDPLSQLMTWGLRNRTTGSKRKSRKSPKNLRRTLSAHRPRKFCVWTRNFSVLAPKFSAACFQQPKPTKKKSKLDQTNSDWAAILHTSSLWSYQGVQKIWALKDQGNSTDREIQIGSGFSKLSSKFPNLVLVRNLLKLTCRCVPGVIAHTHPPQSIPSPPWKMKSPKTQEKGGLGE